MPPQSRRGDELGQPRQVFAQPYRRPAGLRGNLKCIHQALRAQQANAHARRRLVRTSQYGGQIRNAGSAIAHDDHKGIVCQPEFDLTAAGIFERIAHDLRHRGCDPRLVLPVEADEFRQPPRPLARHNDVCLGGDHDLQQARVHLASLGRWPHRDNGGIVATAPVVAQQYASHQRWMLHGEAWIGGDIPACGQSVGVQDHQRIAIEIIGELANARRNVPGRAVVRHHVPRTARMDEDVR